MSTLRKRTAPVSFTWSDPQFDRTGGGGRITAGQGDAQAPRGASPVVLPFPLTVAANATMVPISARAMPVFCVRCRHHTSEAGRAAIRPASRREIPTGRWRRPAMRERYPAQWRSAQPPTSGHAINRACSRLLISCCPSFAPLIRQRPKTREICDSQRQRLTKSPRPRPQQGVFSLMRARTGIKTGSRGTAPTTTQSLYSTTRPH